MKRSSSKLNAELNNYLQHYVFIAAILSIVFAVAWLFALLGTSSISRNAHVAAQYIFSIMALIHSILTLLMHTLRSHEAKENWLKLWYIITGRRGEYTPSRTYATAGGQDLGETELHQSQSIVQPKASAGDEDTAPLSPKVGQTVENVYTMEPNTPVAESKMMVDDEEVKVNLGSGDGDEDDVATAL